MNGDSKCKARLYCLVVPTAQWGYKVQYKPVNIVHGYALTINFLQIVKKKAMYCLYCHFCGNIKHLNINVKKWKDELLRKLPGQVHTQWCHHRSPTHDQFGRPLCHTWAKFSPSYLTGRNKLNRLFFIKENMLCCLPRRQRIQHWVL